MTAPAAQTRIPVAVRSEMLEINRWLWAKRVTQVGLVSAFLIVGGMVFAWPAMAAYVCPSCFGFDRVTNNLFVERAMPAADRAMLRETVATAAAQVATFYGSFDRWPTVLACQTVACDHRLGGRGARATTFGTLFIRLSPRGLNPTILTHEFSHVEFHARVGDYRFLTGSVPAWFDEGLAVIVSNDSRYLGPATSGQTRCLVPPDGEMPSSPFQWSTESGTRPDLYARAACRVLHWIDDNGGLIGLRDAIQGVADGSRSLP